MSNPQQTRSWVFMNDYPNDMDHIKVDIDNILSKLLVFEQDTDTNCAQIIDEVRQLQSKLENTSLRLEAKCKESGEKIDKVEAKIDQKLEQLENKLDKITQSYKSLLKYFNEMHNLDMRELNYNIRSFYTKGIPPVNFVPERMNNLS